MNVWITDEPYPTSDDVLAEATTAGAEQVFHGIPQSLASIIPSDTLGLFTMPDPPGNAGYPPLDNAGALATLLVVEGVLPIEDAANSQHTTPGHLVAEAEAWALG